MRSEDSRWGHLVQLAFHLNESTTPAARNELLRSCLDSALEVFSEVDPVEDYEGYAVRRFLKALRDASQE